MQCDRCGSQYHIDSETAATQMLPGALKESQSDYSTQKSLCPECRKPLPSSTELDSVTDRLVGNAVGRFTIERLVGQGAFGSVYKAWDQQLRRHVALKIQTAHTSDEADAVLREARAASVLKHPGIVSVLEVGNDAKSPFLVTEFVEGVNLRRWLNGERSAPEEAVRMATQIADALAHAHANGVYHRDLKPENILIDEAGSSHIVDFGLAKSTNQSISISGEGQVMGSPSYMPPEQARGESHLADARSDIYSLGMILYRMLTGEVPFRGSLTCVLRQVLEDEPVPPRHLVDSIPRDIEAICLKALSKEPSLRYQTASAFADDLRRFTNGDRVSARPYNTISKLTKWCQNTNRITEAGTFLLFFGIVLSIWAIAGFIGVATRFRFPSQFTASEVAPLSKELATIPLGFLLYASIAWIGWRAMHKSLAALWSGLVILLVLVLVSTAILLNLVLVPIGGMYSNDASTDPLFLLLLILAGIGSLAYGMALIAYYRNRNAIEWAASGKQSFKSQQPGSSGLGR